MTMPKPDFARQTTSLGILAKARPGFSLTEVMVAVVISVFGLAALGGMISLLGKRARDADVPATAALLATERLISFRAQGEGDSPSLLAGYNAVGGAFYAVPADAGTYNPAADPARFNRTTPAGGFMNLSPVMFVREFIFNPSSEQLAAVSQQNAAGQTMREENERIRNRGAVAGGGGGLQNALTYNGGAITVAPNEVPLVPLRIGGTQVDLVVPSVTTLAPAARMAGVLNNPPPLAVSPTGVLRVPMPRTNPGIPANAANDLGDPRIRFVREVWCQMNYPEVAMLPRGPMPVAGGPLPTFQMSPPYSVVVTVRVYRKDLRIRRYSEAQAFNVPGGLGIGYDPALPPLAEMSTVIASVVRE